MPRCPSLLPMLLRQCAYAGVRAEKGELPPVLEGRVELQPHVSSLKIGTHGSLQAGFALCSAWNFKRASQVEVLVLQARDASIVVRLGTRDIFRCCSRPPDFIHPRRFELRFCRGIS